mmetsp:Transcript_15512/g.38096  ORF Transcript_15512/g.38096 Transcript_15512/m.38096 type:complete len:250 (+) Transcript_15512:884-1633(+)
MHRRATPGRRGWRSGCACRSGCPRTASGSQRGTASSRNCPSTTPRRPRSFRGTRTRATCGLCRYGSWRYPWGAARARAPSAATRPAARRTCSAAVPPMASSACASSPSFSSTALVVYHWREGAAATFHCHWSMGGRSAMRFQSAASAGPWRPSRRWWTWWRTTRTRPTPGGGRRPSPCSSRGWSSTCASGTAPRHTRSCPSDLPTGSRSASCAWWTRGCIVRTPLCARWPPPPRASWHTCARPPCYPWS